MRGANVHGGGARANGHLLRYPRKEAPQSVSTQENCSQLPNERHPPSSNKAVRTLYYERGWEYGDGERSSVSTDFSAFLQYTGFLSCYKVQCENLMLAHIIPCRNKFVYQSVAVVVEWDFRCDNYSSIQLPLITFPNCVLVLTENKEKSWKRKQTYSKVAYSSGLFFVPCTSYSTG